MLRSADFGRGGSRTRRRQGKTDHQPARLLGEAQFEHLVLTAEAGIAGLAPAEGRQGLAIEGQHIGARHRAGGDRIGDAAIR